MTVGFYGSHNPYVAPEELFNYYYRILPEPKLLSEKEKEQVHPFDKNLGDVVRTAEEIMDMENTIIPHDGRRRPPALPST